MIQWVNESWYMMNQDLWCLILHSMTYYPWSITNDSKKKIQLSNESWFMVHDRWFMDDVSWIMIHGSLIISLGSLVNSHWIMDYELMDHETWFKDDCIIESLFVYTVSWTMIHGSLMIIWIMVHDTVYMNNDDSMIQWSMNPLN